MTVKNTNLFSVGLFSAIVGLLILRITKGIDFSDEAYYAIFQTDWLISGIAKSSLLTLHQTAALIVHPFVLLYYWINGSSDGLFLFLRIIFLTCNLVAAFFWTFFLRSLGYGFVASISGLLVLSFIPFGLPAPSYNTLAAQGLISALAIFGCAALAQPRSTKQLIYFVASAFFWTITTIAYPPLILCVLFLSLISIVSGAKIYSTPKIYVSLLILFLVLGWSSVIYTLSFAKLYGSIIYLAAVNQPLNYTKLHSAIGFLSASPLFLVLCIISIVVGLLRQRLPILIRMLTTSVILLSLFFIPPTLFARSHDAITLLTLTGLGLLFDLRREVSGTARIIAFIYAISLLAAIITGITALHTLFNFCIGGFSAALLALLPASLTNKEENIKWISLLPIMSAGFVVLSTSLFFYYGEIPSTQPRKKITNGVFSGIHALDNDIEWLSIIKNQVVPLLSKDKSIAIFSSNPGIILAVPAQVKMLLVYPLIPPVSAKALAFTQSFYENPNNRPGIVLVYRDPYFKPVNLMQSQFNNWYRLVHTAKISMGQLEIYEK